MRIYHSLEAVANLKKPVVVSIGNFDGFHLGHQAIFDRIHQLTDGQGSIVIFSFSRHPSAVIRPDKPVSLLCSIAHKEKLLGQQGTDLLFHIPFTAQFSLQTADEFLSSLKKHLHFDTLVLGHDALLGKNREGTPEKIQSLSKILHFAVEYIPAVSDVHGIISSSRIRRLIRDGQLQEAAPLLGRPFSIYSQVCAGLGRGRQLGFHTANFNVAGLCIPPFGVYAVTMNYDGKEFAGIANLGIAPTLQQQTEPKLEVHLFDFNQDLYGMYVEVVLHDFIRPEHRFQNVDELKTQIAKDILSARNILLNKPI